MVCFEADPRRATSGSSDSFALFSGCDVDTSWGSRSSDLVRGLIAVPSVGDQRHVAGRDDDDPGRSGETGEVADIPRRGDNQSVDAGSCEQLTELLRSAGDDERLELGHPAFELGRDRGHVT